jgi:hypothetical protein
MRRFVLTVLLGCLAAAPLAAQGRPPLEQRLDPQTLAALRPILDSAGSDSVPVQALVDKALEGVAKHVPLVRIIAAVRQLAAELHDARTLLRSAPGVAVSDGEIVAAADARRRGVPAKDVATLRSHAPPATSLVVAYTVLGDLVQRGVPADQARMVIEQLLAAGVPAQQIAEIPARMDVGLRVGAPPLDALRGALPMPLRPVKPPQPGAPSPKPNLSEPARP